MKLGGGCGGRCGLADHAVEQLAEAVEKHIVGPKGAPTLRPLQVSRELAETAVAYSCSRESP